MVEVAMVEVAVIEVAMIEFAVVEVAMVEVAMIEEPRQRETQWLGSKMPPSRSMEFFQVAKTLGPLS